MVGCTSDSAIGRGLAALESRSRRTGGRGDVAKDGPEAPVAIQVEMYDDDEAEGEDDDDMDPDAEADSIYYSARSSFGL